MCKCGNAINTLWNQIYMQFEVLTVIYYTTYIKNLKLY